MISGDITLQLVYRVKERLTIPTLEFSDRVLHTNYLLSNFPDGVLLFKKHNHPQTYLHFDQEHPCILIQVDENGLAQGFHSSDSGEKHHGSLLISDKYFALIPNKKGITANDFIGTKLISQKVIK